MRETKTIKQVIVVEDDPQDYELITHALHRSGEDFAVRRVDASDELEEELLRLAPDVVLCDHASARWNSFEILEQVRAFQSTMPFIVVSGAIDDQTQAELLSRGADGCVGKDRLSDLPPVVQQALNQRAEDQRRRVDEIRRHLLPLAATRPRRARPVLQACAG